jgi:hypothetical protein
MRVATLGAVVQMASRERWHRDLHSFDRIAAIPTALHSEFFYGSSFAGGKTRGGARGIEGHGEDRLKVGGGVVEREQDL